MKAYPITIIFWFIRNYIRIRVTR